MSVKKKESNFLRTFTVAKKSIYADFVPPPRQPDEEPSKSNVPDRLLDGVAMYSKNFQMHMKGGLLEPLISKLCQRSTSEVDIEIFLFGYKAITTPIIFLERLFVEWEMKPPRNLSEMLPYEVDEWKDNLKVTRLKILRILKLWISYGYLDFLEPDLNKSMTEKLQKHVARIPDFSSMLKEIHEMLTPKFAKERAQAIEAYRTSALPPWDTPPIFSTNIDDVDHFVFATQLALITQELWRRIPESEFVNQAWYKSPDRCKNLGKFILFCQDIKEWAATQILQYDQVKDRVRVMKKIMEIAAISREIKSFSVAYQIWSCLFLPEIQRMKCTWGKVEKEKRFRELYSFFRADLDYPSNFSEYRAQLPEVPTDIPCVPSLGILLHDLNIIGYEEPDYLTVVDNTQNAINFIKLKRQHNILRSLIPYRVVSYNFQKVDIIFNFFSKEFTFDDVLTRLNKSKAMEPKDRELLNSDEIAEAPFPLAPHKPPTTISTISATTTTTVLTQSEGSLLKDLPKISLGRSAPTLITPKKNFSIQTHQPQQQSPQQFPHISQHSYSQTPQLSPRKQLIITNYVGLSPFDSGGIDPKSKHKFLPNSSGDLNSDGLLIGPKETILGGKLEKILLKILLRSNLSSTHEFSAYLSSFRKHQIPADLLKILRELWDHPGFSSEILDSPEAKPEKKELTDMQCRISQFLLVWLTDFFFDFSSDRELLLNLRKFLQETVYTYASASTAIEITNQIKNNVQNIRNKQMNKEYESDDEKDINTSNFSSTWKLIFEQFSTDEIADQLTSYEQQLYALIEMREWLFFPWNESIAAEIKITPKSDMSAIPTIISTESTFFTDTFSTKTLVPKSTDEAPNLKKFLSFSNNFTCFICEELLAENLEKEKISAITKLLEIAIKCRQLNNFNAFQEISLALFGSKIVTQSHIWEKVTKNHADIFEKYSSYVSEFSPAENYKEYRKNLYSTKHEHARIIRKYSRIQFQFSY